MAHYKFSASRLTRFGAKDNPSVSDWRQLVHGFGDDLGICPEMLPFVIRPDCSTAIPYEKLNVMPESLSKMTQKPGEMWVLFCFEDAFGKSISPGSPLRKDGFVLILEWRRGASDSPLLASSFHRISKLVREQLGVEGWGLWPAESRYKDKVDFTDADLFGDVEHADQIDSAYGALLTGLHCASSTHYPKSWPKVWPFPTIKWDSKANTIASVGGIEKKLMVAVDCGAECVCVARGQKICEGGGYLQAIAARSKGRGLRIFKVANSIDPKALCKSIAQSANPLARMHLKLLLTFESVTMNLKLSQKERELQRQKRIVAELKESLTVGDKYNKLPWWGNALVQCTVPFAYCIGGFEFVRAIIYQGSVDLFRHRLCLCCGLLLLLGWNRILIGSSFVKKVICGRVEFNLRAVIVDAVIFVFGAMLGAVAMMRLCICGMFAANMFGLYEMHHGEQSQPSWAVVGFVGCWFAIFRYSSLLILRKRIRPNTGKMFNWILICALPILSMYCVSKTRWHENWMKTEYFPDKVSAALKAKDYERVWKLLPLADENSAIVQGAYADAYLSGLGVKPDCEKAALWYEKLLGQSANANMTKEVVGKINYKLGVCYHCLSQFEAAATNMAKSVQLGNNDGWYFLGQYYEIGIGGLDLKLSSAKLCYEKALECDNQLIRDAAQIALDRLSGKDKVERTPKKVVANGCAEHKGDNSYKNRGDPERKHFILSEGEVFVVENGETNSVIPVVPYTGATKVYEVKAGDELYAIALNYDIDIGALKALNGLDPGPKGSDIKVKQRLLVPARKDVLKDGKICTIEESSNGVHTVKKNNSVLGG